MQKDIQNLLGCETTNLKEKLDKAVAEPPQQTPAANQVPQVGLMLKRVSSIDTNPLNEEEFKKALQN